MGETADMEVAEVLREIRERVRAEAMTAHNSLSTSTQNGHSAATVEATDALSQFEANLSVTERAWDKLPPLLSYRHGITKRIELWLKRCIKRATHWFTWEQVNFNAAANNALRNALVILRAYEQRSISMQEQMTTLEARVRTFEEHAQLFQEQIALLKEQSVIFLKEQNAAGKGVAQLQRQLNELGGHVFDEQRVCFKQLKLEINETTMAADRAQRKLQAQLDRLAREAEGLRVNAAKQG